MTFPGGQPDPQQQPYQPSYGPPAQFGPPPGYAPPPAPDATQRGGKWALLGVGAFLVLTLLVVGGYFTFQKVFVDTPSEVVQAYLDEATKSSPDPAKLEKYLCKDEAAKLRRELSNDPSSSSSDNRILDWHVTGEAVTGKTATVYTEFTIKASTGRTSNENLNLTLVKENRAWKICGYAV